MRTTSFALAAAAGLASTAMADFAIWNTNVATAGAPGGPLKSAVFVQYLDSGIACADFESENKHRFDDYTDVTPDRGGVSCDGCEHGVDFDRYEYWDGPTDLGNAIFSQPFGFITLRPQADSEDWYFDYVSADRDESGVVTNSRCVRAEGEATCSIAVATRTASKLFDCFTDIEVVAAE